MNKLRIELDEDVFEPGSEVCGRVIWRSIERPRELLVSLLWYTAGKGTEDVGIVDQQTVTQPPAEGRHDFRFLLPELPWSFSGELISLVWAVEANLEPGGRVDLVRLISAPGGREVRF